MRGTALGTRACSRFVHTTMMVTSITQKLFGVERTSSCRIYQELAGEQDATNYAGFRTEDVFHPPPFCYLRQIRSSEAASADDQQRSGMLANMQRSAVVKR